MTRENRWRLEFDAAAIVASIFFAMWLTSSGILGRTLVYVGDLRFVESFIAGILFTSAFTTAPAIVILGNIAQHSSPTSVALVGAMGAVFGDLLLFSFIRDRVSEDLFSLLGENGAQRVRKIFERRLFHWFSPLVAGFIIASPLPDEMAVLLLGFANTRTPIFVLYSFVANFIGIFLVCWLATAIA